MNKNFFLVKQRSVDFQETSGSGSVFLLPPLGLRPSLWNLKKEYSDEKEHIKENKHGEEKGHWFDRFEKPTPPGQSVNQIFREVLDNDESKLTASAEICKARSRYGTVVSCRWRWDAEMVWDYLTREGFYASRWHGDLKKLQQERSEMEFKKGTFNVYVVTEDLFHWMDPPTGFTLLNFDLPVHFEDYKRMLLKFGTIDNLISKKSSGMCLIKLIHSGIAVPPFVKMIYEEMTIDRK